MQFYQKPFFSDLDGMVLLLDFSFYLFNVIFVLF
jgi:hypothetical protein